MAMYDITVPISEDLVVWPGDPSVEIDMAADMDAGDSINLSGISPGLYQLICLPLNITDCDGAPARVILIDTQ